MQKNQTKTLIWLGIGSLLLSTACQLTDMLSNFAVNRGTEVEKQVELTLTALAEEAPEETQAPSTEDAPTSAPEPTDTPSEEPLLEMGVITGSLAYPSEVLPPQRVVAFEANDLNNYFMTEVQSGGEYRLEVPPRTYFVIAYLISPEDLGATPGLAGGYSKAVPCGLTADCEDHSLISVVVTPGETVEGIDPVDWYLPPEQASSWPGDPTKEETGGIRGGLGYPSEYIPPLRVVAFDVFSQDYSYVDTQRNQDSYEIADLPPGTYHVVAYVREEGPELAGGYSYFVTCGMTVNCTNHNLVDVNVYAGQVAEGVDPVDFYIQPEEANWPENPTQ